MVGDGLWEMGEGLVGLAIFNYNWTFGLPSRLIFDRDGVVRDLEGFGKGVMKFGETFSRDPGGTLREVGKNIIDYDDMVKDPAHWLGHLVPTIAGFFVGAGEASAGVKAAESVGKAGQAIVEVSRIEAIGKSIGVGNEAILAARAAKGELLSIDRLTADPHFDIGRWANRAYIGMERDSQRGHMDLLHNNGTTLSNDEYLTTQRQIQDLAANPKRPYDNIFNSRSIANESTSVILQAHHTDIETWLKTTGDNPRLVIEGSFDQDIGIGIKRWSHGIDDILPTNQVRLVLRKTNEMPEGFIVQTGYPVYIK